MTPVTLQIAKRLREQKRPFKIVLQGYERDGTMVRTLGDVEHVEYTFWSAWDLDTGGERVFTNTNEAGIKTVITPFPPCENHIHMLLSHGFKYAPNTVYTEAEARPMNWNELPLVYRRITQLIPALRDGVPYFVACDKDNRPIMELTPEGAESLRGFKLNLVL